MRHSPLLLGMVLFGCARPEPPPISTPVTDGASHAMVDSAQYFLSGLALRLVGEWHDVQADGRTVFHEQWERTDDAHYTGLGFVMSGTDTVFIEHLGISWDTSGARYSARIPSQNAGAYVDFELDHASTDSLVFVNAAHDFPQRIRYAVLGNDVWNVRVSGVQQGRNRKEDFHFTRRPQPQAATLPVR